jgi:hypothetical protein
VIGWTFSRIGTWDARESVRIEGDSAKGLQLFECCKLINRRRLISYEGEAERRAVEEDGWK